ncbi:acetylornithine deacetylase [Caulobacter sp. SLTY]|uniref:acetylornithine deacetylase n=1 Tax=Caulobacter sp. SLTY TaxID=2683262 RepID=UPI001412E24B|nr:acetylornithine deacetylase [Caulobacter sp. SLTY]NBB13821.1 acetylornithine deacetylase [Caulobacter sp. SLTY]
MNSETLHDRAVDILATLVGFDTTSRDSNLPLIDWVEGYLAGHGVNARRIANADGTKANLMARIGPATEGGVILSGHTDVVPVDGQPWSTDPFVLTEKDGRLYGRGSADMKGFVALALAAVPDLTAAELKAPVWLAFSYDEEIGCLGAPAMIEALAAENPPPALAVVGEPTGMEVVGAHKGILSAKVVVTGKEAHSSQTHLGVSANMAALELMGELKALADRLAAQADPASPFEPGHATLTIGLIHGGTAVNILARECEFSFDLRCPADQDPHALLAPFWERCAAMDAQLKAKAEGAGVVWSLYSDVPSLALEPGGPAEALARRLAGDNGPLRAVSYAAEAGQFQRGGFPVVLCGPGWIDQAHQPDEWIEIAQLRRGAGFMTRLVEALS